MKKSLLIALIALSGCKETPPVTKSYFPCEESLFWKVVCYAESGCQSGSYMTEPLNPSTVSAGLYQLSIGAAAQYGCDFKEFKDILDPKKNTDCKNRIASKLIQDNPSEPWDMALGRYWGVMRRADKWKSYHAAYKAKTGKDHTGYKNLQFYGAKFGCPIP